MYMLNIAHSSDSMSILWGTCPLCPFC